MKLTVFLLKWRKKMPQINRLRIINFSYNNNFRNILDETFDFCQGENALLNLKNGGGKSVLVQLMLQPIIPKTKLMGRKIDDFFKGKKTPSYILIEWKLEDKGGYLLTGIALSNRETQNREHDEEANNVKYFTFTNHYREANLFDIIHIPLMRKEGDKLYIEDFKDAKKLLTYRDKTKDLNIQIFTDETEDRAHYRKILESYNIFRDEWDSIVLKINESEGGVIEIFEKCKTSQQLMNDWILKSIEKVVNKDDNDQKKLELMLENLVEEMILNEQYIYEKEIYSKFNIDLDSFINKLNSFVISLDREKDLEKELSIMYYYLKSELIKLDESIKKSNEDIIASQEELKKIEIEERSKYYYDQQALVNNLENEKAKEKGKLEILQEKLSEVTNDLKVQQAAREYSCIKSLNIIIAGINEEINKIKGNSQNKEKIKNLEYSLKLAYENLLSKLYEKSKELTEKQSNVVKNINECDSKIINIDSTINSNEKLLGEVSAYIKNFIDEEQKTKSLLGFNYDRNLYGEIEKNLTQNYTASLEKEKIKLTEEKESSKLEIIKLGEVNKSITDKVNLLNNEKFKKSIDSNNLKTEIEKYYRLETSLKDIFHKHAIDFNKRFNFEENILFINNKISQLQGIEREVEWNKKSVNEKIISLKEGTYHVSKEFREWLRNKNIDFETGENYLRKQEERIRNKLISQNPMLPYAFIMYEDDIKKIESMDLDININQVVPVLSYKDINEIYAVSGKEVEINNKLHIVCLYDNKMINAENIDSYMEELNNELNETSEKLVHYNNELKVAREDSYFIMQFDYDRNYIYEQEYNHKDLEEEIIRIQIKAQELENTKESNLNTISTFISRISEINTLLEKLENKKQKFEEFLEKDKNYLNNLSIQREYSEAIKKFNNEKNLINEQKILMSSEKDKLLMELQSIGNKIIESEKNYQLYICSERGIIVDDTIENMEERLRVLKSTIANDLNRLENDLKLKSQDLDARNNDLKAFNLKESQYVDVSYNKEKSEQLQKQANQLDNEYKKQNLLLRNTENWLSKEQGKLENIRTELLKLTPVPINPELIKLNFDGRRGSEHEKIKFSRDNISNLEVTIKVYSDVTRDIDNRIKIEKFQVNTDYKIKVSVKEDFRLLNKELNDIHLENEKYEKNINSQYIKIRGEYIEKNKNIENIFTGLDPLIDGAANDNNKYYYLGERIIYSSESLKKLIEACDLRLSNLEKSKKDMIQHSYLHGLQVHDEIQKIADNSSIHVDGKSKHMLKIEMIPLEESADDNINKMKAYIEFCINIIKQDMKEDKKTDEIRKKISKYMSTRELLNVLSDLGKMVIKAYKFDINEKNSKYKTWEQVMKENSGGERFVSFFAVLIALISYTRTSKKYADDYERNKDTKVLIMDNPFGPISSEHLLKPLFNIAKKYNTQLICLTDLKQNSIMNCFNLIYMIKIRQNILGTSEYVQLEKQIKNEDELEKDEKLEKAVFKAQEVEQLKLF